MRETNTPVPMPRTTPEICVCVVAVSQTTPLTISSCSRSTQVIGHWSVLHRGLDMVWACGSKTYITTNERRQTDGKGVDVPELAARDEDLATHDQELERREHDENKPLRCQYTVSHPGWLLWPHLRGRRAQAGSGCRSR